MSVTALFATAGATNAGLYPAAGLCEQMATTGQFPPAARPAARRPGAGRPAPDRGDRDRPRRRLRPERDRVDRQRDRAPRVRARQRRPPAGPPRDRRARRHARRSRSSPRPSCSSTFAFTTLVDEPGTAVALVVIVALSVALDFGWKHAQDNDAPVEREPAQRSRGQPPSANSSRFRAGHDVLLAGHQRRDAQQQRGEERHEQRNLEREGRASVLMRMISACTSGG